MKFLDARKLDGKQAKKSLIPPENKMKPGTRLDQNDPMSLVSSPRGRGTPTKATSDSDDAAIQKLAGELHVDLSTVTGTGPKGVITEKDIRNAKNNS